jgi:hypothetical protein
LSQLFNIVPPEPALRIWASKTSVITHVNVTDKDFFHDHRSFFGLILKRKLIKIKPHCGTNLLSFSEQYLGEFKQDF